MSDGETKAAVSNCPSTESRFCFTCPLCTEAGEGLASRMGSGEEQQQRAEKLDNSNSGAKPGENAEIAQKGDDQFKQGLEQMTGRK